MKLAAVAHAGISRKGTDLPYITHPVHVARLLDRAGCRETLVLAGLLHDVVEDLDPSNAAARARFRSVVPDLADAPDDHEAFAAMLETYIRDEFGEDVLRLVDAVTERKEAGGLRRSWLERKTEQLQHLRHAPDDVVLLKSADTLHNAASVLSDLHEVGDAVFDRFERTKADTLWWYQSVADIAMDRMAGSGHPLIEDLRAAVDRLVREAKG
jgi:(p)ppGpp synthase/HD superfamily hydrolase